MIKKYISTLGLIFILFLSTTALAQNKITASKDYTPHIGTTVAMLEDMKTRVERSVSNLSIEETDFLLDDKANRIGAMIYHLAATEKFYQVFTFENRTFNKEEEKIWQMPLELGEVAQDELQGKPISYYLDIWNEVRAETIELLKKKDDKWFFKNVRKGGMNNYWAWYHVMEHQANHMGQIRLIIKRIPQ